MGKKLFLLVINIILINLSFLVAQESVSEEFARPADFEACEGKVKLISSNSSDTLLAVSDGKCVTVYDERDYSLVSRFYDEKVSRISFFIEGDNEYFAVITADGQFIVRKLLFNSDEKWELEDGEPYFSADCADATGRKALTAVSFSNNSDYVAAAFDDNTVQVHFRLRVTAGSISHTITTHKTPVYGLEFSRNGEFLATVSSDGEAYIWNSYTSSKITHLSGIYTREKIPVCFSDDSLYIVSVDGRNSFRISDFSGNTLYSILTGRPITAIRPLKDPDLIAIRDDKNEVMIYSISSRRPVAIATVKSNGEFTSFEFDSKSDLMFAGFDDGKVCFVETQPYLDESSMIVTEAKLAGKKGGAGFGSLSRFQSVSVCGGANFLASPYSMSASLRGEYLYSEAIAPFFAGGGVTFSIGFPRSDFPANYKINNQNVNPPNIISAVIYAPVGYVFSPWDKDIHIITSFKAGFKILALAMITGSGSIVDTPNCAFFMSIGAGMQIKHFVFDINCEYDTIGKVSPSIFAGYVFKWEKVKK